MSQLPCVVKGCRHEGEEVLNSPLGGYVFLCKPHHGSWATSNVKRVAKRMIESGDADFPEALIREAWLMWMAATEKSMLNESEMRALDAHLAAVKASRSP